jgi:putative long chain acyl-CoA synthase
VFGAAVNDAAGRVGAVDLAVTYRVQDGSQTLAVTALALVPGGSIPTADLNEAIAALAVGSPPDFIHVVPDMKLSATYRPLLAPLRAAGVPRPARNSWYLDEQTNEYKRLTTAVRAELLHTSDGE